MRARGKRVDVGRSPELWLGVLPPGWVGKRYAWLSFLAWSLALPRGLDPSFVGGPFLLLLFVDLCPVLMLPFNSNSALLTLIPFLCLGLPFWFWLTP